MPPFRADDFGPALGSEHVIKVHEDERELRAHVPEGWRVSEPSAAALSFRRVKDGIVVPWDPVAGIGVEDFLETALIVSSEGQRCAAHRNDLRSWADARGLSSPLPRRRVAVKGFSERVPVYEAMPSA